jgi:hypothetical protein
MRQKDTGAAGVNVFFRVEGAPARISDSIWRLVVATFPGDDKEAGFENSLFDGMLKEPGTDHELGKLPTGGEQYVTLVGKPLSNEVWKKVEEKSAAVYFMGRFKYSDRKTEFHSDYCGFFMGNPPPHFMCRYHNEEP